ncbi:MAG: hypothetical protein ACK4E3_03490 [Brevundimonas sp.]|uniref:hypothetical protein n=1 Tax=Brevundimonas sp. TaxID=1871086 RepID=UPI00391BDEDF
MSNATVYFVQTYWKDRLRLNMGVLRSAPSEASAREMGERLSRREDGVIVYCLKGCTDLDVWSEPITLAVYGETPLTPAGDNSAISRSDMST